MFGNPEVQSSFCCAVCVRGWTNMELSEFRDDDLYLKKLVYVN